jgi:hypothetical protein
MDDESVETKEWVDQVLLIQLFFSWKKPANLVKNIPQIQQL